MARAESQLEVVDTDVTGWESVVLTADAMAARDLEPGAVALVAGTRTTAGTVEPPADGLEEGTVALGEPVRSNAGVASGSLVSVTAREPRDADSLTVVELESTGRVTEAAIKRDLSGRVVTVDDEFDLEFDDATSARVRVICGDPTVFDEDEVFSTVEPLRVSDATTLHVSTTPSAAVRDQLLAESRTVFEQSVTRRNELETAALGVTEQNALIVGLVFAGLTLWADLRSGGDPSSFVAEFTFFPLLVVGLLSLLLSVVLAVYTYADRNHRLSRGGLSIESVGRFAGIGLDDVRAVIRSEYEPDTLSLRRAEANTRWARLNNQKNREMKRWTTNAQIALVVGFLLIGLVLVLELLVILGYLTPP
ncbi:hypothetical protein [Natronobiforma cellulositropha]|uniref:hypothetical protein n=1 Tax=Natronobiforma cellulositropha TaxID=1679076 RepID=UPI0021D57BB0|nr:hypothetical protein [Natronobiforma cellulositropha]